jgi:hypothetical protein
MDDEQVRPEPEPTTRAVAPAPEERGAMATIVEGAVGSGLAKVVGVAGKAACGKLTDKGDDGPHAPPPPNPGDILPDE